MGWYVHIHVCFACDTNVGVAAIAAKHLPALAALDTADGAREARWFLGDLAGRTGGNSGPRGGLSLWGMVGNYTRGDVFCEVLRPFWEDLLSGVDGGPCSFERVVVFVENEQSDAATAYQIGWDDNDSPTRELIIQKHESLPFAWGQM